MGKKREREENSSELGSSKKKHKKNKHSHKNKHYKEKSHPITLKIKLGDKLISTTGDGSYADDVSSVAESESLSLVEQSVGVSEQWEGSDISVGKDDFEVGSNEYAGEEEEEEAWLDALESGEVDERGYIPSKKSSALTARQRALLGEEENESLLELPLTKKGSTTEEDLLKKMEKNQKRRLAAQRRKEKRKAETVRKLIEKQTTKKRDEEKPKPVFKQSTPHIRYVISSRPLESAAEAADHTPSTYSLLSLPMGMDYPIAQQTTTSPPAPTLCAIEGCGQVKRYSDSLTKQPLCSLQCYQVLRRMERSVQDTVESH